MSQGDLTGKVVLVVEDDYIQARIIADALTEYGAIIAGPFPTVDEALVCCKEDPVDAAVLDIKIGEGSSLPLADRLLSENVPFIFLTGYDRNIIPSRFKNIPHYLKPFVGSDAPAALVLAMAQARVRTNRHRLPPGRSPALK